MTTCYCDGPPHPHDPQFCGRLPSHNATSSIELERDRRRRVLIDDADSPAVEGGTYVIAYCELVDGYRHAFYNEDRRRVCYARTIEHPADPRCPGCGETS